MLDVNKNGKIDPEEDALGELLTENIAEENRENRPLSFIAAVVALLVIAVIAALIFLG